jgi:hypothetical protein
MSNYRQSPEKIAYNQIHDSFTNAKSFSQLRIAAVNAQQIIKDNNIDAYQAEKLEQYGIARFNEITRREDQLSRMASSNKRR